MSIWKPALLGAVLAVAGCQPAGVPVGEERIASKVADVLLTDNLTRQFVVQQMQGVMAQGAVSQDQVNQVGMAVSREVQARMPEVKKTLVASMTREFNIKELDFLLKLLTSKEGEAVTQKNDVVMQEAMTQLDVIAREATASAVAKVNSAWPTGANPAPPPQPPMPDGMQLPN